METFLQSITMTLFYSIPSTFIIIMFALVFWGADYRLFLKRAVVFAIFQPLIGDITLTVLPNGLHLLYFLAVYIPFFFLIFRSLPLTQRIAMFLFNFVAGVLLEFMMVNITLPFYDQSDRFEHAWFNLAILWPLMLLYGFITYLFAKKKIYPGKRVLSYLNTQKTKRLIFFILFLIIQFIMAILILSSILDNVSDSNNSSFFLLIVFEIVTWIIFFMQFKTISKVKEEAINHTQDVYLKDIENMFTSIRGQRHDFLNHVQVIRSMIERDKIEDLKRYTGDLIGEIDEVNEIIHIGHPAIAALIQAKIAKSMSEKIRFSFHFSGLQYISSGIKSIDIVKIMGNLIDNAFDEVSMHPQTQRWVEIQGHVKDRVFQLTVKNPILEFSDFALSSFFQPGFTTKNQESHSGLGLSIIKEIAERYQGKVNVEKCSGNEVHFHVNLTM